MLSTSVESLHSVLTVRLAKIVGIATPIMGETGNPTMARLSVALPPKSYGKQERQPRQKETSGTKE